MNKPPISFRLTDKEWEVLEREQQPNESINQTAARLLREKLGVQSLDNEHILKTNTLSSWITDEVNKNLQSVKFAFESLAEDKINQEIFKIHQRLLDIEARLTSESTKKSISNFEKTSIWRVGSRCDVQQPSGTIIFNMKIASVDRKNKTCKVVDEETNTHFLASFDQLNKPSQKRSRLSKQEN